MWQIRNQVLYSPTGPTIVTSYCSLNYRINEEKRTGTDDIDRSNYHLFSNRYTINKLRSSSIHDKNLWLEMVCMARVDYEEPDYVIIRQAISIQNQIQAFLITNGPLLPVLSRKRPIVTQDNCISVEDQHAATFQFFWNPITCSKAYSNHNHCGSY